MIFHFITALESFGTWSLAVFCALAILAFVVIGGATAADFYSKNKAALEAIENRLRSGALPSGLAHIPPGTNMTLLYGLLIAGPYSTTTFSDMTT